LIVVRELISLGELCRSDRLRELVERCGKGQSGTCIDSEFVVASSQVLDEGVASDGDQVDFWTEPESSES